LTNRPGRAPIDSLEHLHTDRENEGAGIVGRIFSQNRCAFLLLVLAVLVAVAVRVRLAQTPLERDEGEYAYAGQLMLQGIAPYKLAFNMKLPGTYAGYAAIMALFGETTEGIHLGFLVVNLATVALLFFVARRLLDGPHALVACACYALLSISPGVLGLAGHATHLVTLAALGGVLLLLKGGESARARTFWCSGLLFGLAFLCKQPGLFFGMFGAAVMLRDACEAPRSERWIWARNFAWFCLGGALPFLVTCCLIWRAGTFHRFWFWTVVYAQVHANLLPWGMAREALANFYMRAGVMRWSWLAAAAGLVCLLAGEAPRRAKFLIVCLLGFSLMAFTASFYFSRHYFIVVLPVLSLLIAIAVRSAARRFGGVISMACFAAACGLFVFANRTVWFELSPPEVCRSLYGANPFPEAVEIGKYIRENSAPGATIAVLGSEPEIYFYARRHSASGYIYMYEMMQNHPYAAAMQREMIHDVEEAKPEFLVWVHVPSSWTLWGDSDLTLIKWSAGYEQRFYDVVGATCIWSDHPTEYFWGPEAAARENGTMSRVLVLRRKPGL